MLDTASQAEPPRSRPDPAVAPSAGKPLATSDGAAASDRERPEPARETSTSGLPRLLAPMLSHEPDELLRKSRRLFQKVFDFGQRGYQRALARAAALAPDGPIGGVCALTDNLPFTSEQILLGYAQGMFPMDRRGHVHWHCPDPRCAIPLERLHVPSRIRTYLRKGLFELGFDRAPRAVLAACGDRTDTWLTPRLQEAYLELFELGAMHTVEAYAGDRLVGGAFGVALGGVFTVESMFSREDHASKLAFAFLAQHLVQRGFVLLDCQYWQAHFERFGAVDMSRSEYRDRLARSLIHPPSFYELKRRRGNGSAEEPLPPHLV